MITAMRWYNSRACIGIVQVVQDHELDRYRETGKANFRYYIGLGNGLSEQADSKYIAEWGASFDTAAGDLIFSNCSDQRGDQVC